ncbi:hypothetical protein ACFS07_08645 [Undibacterium arcticum]
MTRDETLIFKQFDSASTQVARFTPHAAFEHPHAPADAPLRESIEIRCLLVFLIIEGGMGHGSKEAGRA